MRLGRQEIFILLRVAKPSFFPYTNNKMARRGQRGSPMKEIHYANIKDVMNLTIKNLSKKYRGDVWGLKNFSITLGPGVLGLLGPNGAGKSTLMRILATITKPTDGSVLWNGADVVRHPDPLRAVLGYLPQDFGVYPHLTAMEFLEYLAAAKGLEYDHAKRRIEELLQLVNLIDVRKRPLGGYSGGMKQRIGIAQALLNDPKLLIVDEPTGGLDPEERVRFRNLLSELSGERIVILSTHIVSDVEATATEIAIIRKGELVTHAAPEKLLAALQGKVWEWIVASADLPAIKLRYQISGTIRRSDGVQIRVIADSSPDAAATPVTPNLEDAYLYFISDRARSSSAAEAAA
jgi:ABC-2 type transport system ATP-binding protein